ncbi:MAG TPA: hypothetical protein VKN74_04345 [Candidatus Mcinerneyibacterium sp.]|nr:hypothetical protein [Candidatus Mcinerneyibacterium sp.]
MWEKIRIKKYLPYIIILLILTLFLNLFVKNKIDSYRKIEDIKISEAGIFFLDSEKLNYYSLKNESKKTLSIRDHNYLVLTDKNNLYIFSRKKEKIIVYKNFKKEKIFKIKGIDKVFYYENEFYILTDKKLLLYNKELNLLDSFSVGKKIDFIYKKNEEYYFFNKKTMKIEGFYNKKEIKTLQNKVAKKLEISDIGYYNDKLFFLARENNSIYTRFYIFDFKLKKIYESDKKFSKSSSISKNKNAVFVFDKERIKVSGYNIDKVKELEKTRIKKIKKAFRDYYNIRIFVLLGIISYIIIIILMFLVLLYLARIKLFNKGGSDETEKK